MSFSTARQLSDPDAPRRYNAEGIVRQLYKFVPSLLLFLAVVILFGVLLYKRRLGFRVGIALVVLATVYEIVGGITGDDASVGALVAFVIGVRIFLLLYLLALWTVAESLLRDTVPGFTTSLDAFAAGRLGPRGGRAILAGLGGARRSSVFRCSPSARRRSRRRSGVWPSSPSFPYPLFQTQKGPFYEGAFDTALLVLFVALLRFVLPRRFASVAAAVLFALYSSIAMPLHPWGAGLALSLAFAAVLLWAFDRYGLGALLVAAVSSALLRDALVACLHLDGNMFPALLTVLPLLAIAAAGAIGLARPERDEEGRLDAPDYVRRLESERRVKYEMDLLSRMQLSLLPEKPPVVPGLELSVKTILATEAGGDLYDFVQDESGALWIAAGDVSGHGYSCGIQQAMVMASLASLVKAGRNPSEILVEIDRVLRMGRSGRLFTSVALLRLDPATGVGVLANAGHPFPILLHDGKASEIAGSGPAARPGAEADVHGRAVRDSERRRPRRRLGRALRGARPLRRAVRLRPAARRPRVRQPLAAPARFDRRGSSRGLAPARGRGRAVGRHDDPRRQAAAVLMSRKPPLEGVVVLDLSRVLAGPIATMVLADLGARVVKVEDPRGGDFSRGWKPPALDGESAYFLSVNRRKESAAVDLGTPDGAEFVRRWAAKADVLVENFLPGALERRGLGVDSLQRAEPAPRRVLDLGRGRRGAGGRRPGLRPPRAGRHRPHVDHGAPDGGPHKMGVALIDVLAGWSAVTAILGALHARERDGTGAHVKTNLVSTGLAALANVAGSALVTGTGSHAPRQLARDDRAVSRVRGVGRRVPPRRRHGPAVRGPVREGHRAAGSRVRTRGSRRTRRAS